MKKRILKILANSFKPVKGKVLASSLNVSDRTIRKYINEINKSEKIIKSTSQGYSLTDFKNQEMSQSSNIYAFQNQDERILLIIEKVISSKESCNLYDIADSLFVSYSTIEKDVQHIKKLLNTYNLKLIRSKGKISIEGDETEERRLIHDLLRKSSMNIDQILLDMSTDIRVDIDEIKNMLLEEIINNNLYVNDYAIKNIIIHVIIALTRIKNNNLLKSIENQYENWEYCLEINCAENFIKRIKTKYMIDFNDVEKQQLVFLIISKTSRIDALHPNNDTKTIIGAEYINFTKKIIKQINRLYYIDLNDADFINFFSIHLENVIFRCKNNTYNRNPFANTIYIQNPLIYDIATFIANQIKHSYNCALNRDEITFIALHVGAIIEKYNNHNNLHAILLINDYYYLQTDALTKIEESGRIIDTTLIKGTLDNINIEDYDFIINATAPSLDLPIPTIHVSPFLNQKDIQKILKFIDRFDTIKNKKNLKNMYEDFFKEKHFEINHYEDSVDAMISYMSKQLINDNLVTPEFTTAVLEREHLTPTSFDNRIAIPHSIVVSSLENCAYVIINEKPMAWGYFDVNIIILLGVNNAKRNSFKELYVSLLDIITDEKAIQELIHVKSYHEFMQILLDD